MIKIQEIKEEGKRSELTNNLHLCYMALNAFPLLKGINLENLTRLDLSNNNIQLFPSEIISLVNLKELWLQNNPLTGLNFKFFFQDFIFLIKFKFISSYCNL
jgi:Leucine-rich repeat (LRR) protein